MATNEEKNIEIEEDDLSLDDLFTEEDMQELQQAQDLRKNILKNVGIKNLIDIIRDIIDNSKDYEFTSATKRKFISTNTPIFTIRKKDYKPDPKKIKNQTYIDNEIDNIVREINREILTNITDKIIQLIQEDEKLKEIYNNLSEDLKDIIWSTVFEIRCSIQDNIIYLRYCI